MRISVASPRSARGLAAPLRALVRAALALEGVRPGEIGIVLTDDATLRDLNRRYRGIDRATDVLSFGYDGEPPRSDRVRGAPRGPRASAILAPGRSSRRAPAPASARLESLAAAPDPIALGRLTPGSGRGRASRSAPGPTLPIVGDIVISLDRMAEQALRFRVSRGRELARLVIHGALHLAGLDHHRPADRRHMRGREACVLRSGREAIRVLERGLI